MGEVGDELLDRWYRQHYSLLVLWVGKRVRDREAAEDICQNAFIYLHKLSSRAEITCPRAVLYKTAAWLAANEFRRRRRAALDSRSFDLLEESQCEESHLFMGDSLDAQIVRREEARLALDAIGMMPDKPQQVFRLSRFEGKTYNEIARQMKLSKSSVEKHMSSALRFVRAAKAAIEN